MLPNSRNRLHSVALTAACAILSSCGGGSGASPTPTYAVGGSVSGLLSGNSVVLQNNGANATSISVNASFTFSTPVASGGAYFVSVQTQPTGQTCSVTNASGVVANADISVAVTCVANSYTVGGTLSGLLPGTNLALTTSGASLSLQTNGNFTFSPALVTRSTYAVQIQAQPVGESCVVTGGTGTVTSANVTNVAVICSPEKYAVNVNVFGLLPNSKAVLQDDGGDNLTVSGYGTFTFKTALPTQGSYQVTVLNQPTSQQCFVSNGTGSIVASNVSVSLVCPWEAAYFLDYYGNEIAAYYLDPTTGGILALGSSPYTGLGGPTGIAISPTGPYLYVTNQGIPVGSITALSINPSTGVLSPISGSPFATGSAPQFVAVDPTGKFLYSGLLGGTEDFQTYYPEGLAAFSIDQSTGGLSPIANSAYAAGTEPAPLLVDPTGALVLTGGANYAINAETGALTALAGSNVIGPEQEFPTAAVYSNANFDNVMSVSSNGLAVYSINPGNGTLTPISGSPFALGSANGVAVTVTPNARFAYVLSGPSNEILGFAINQTTGAPSPIAAVSSTNMNSSNSVIAVDPSGQFLYESSQTSGEIVGFSINQSTGALTKLAGSPFAQAPNIEGGFAIGFYALH